MIPSFRIAFCSQWPLKRWSQLLTAERSKGAHLSLLHWRQNMKGKQRKILYRHIQIITWGLHCTTQLYCTYTSVAEMSARVAWPIPVAAVMRLRRQRCLWPRAAYKQRTLKVPIRREHYADRGILSGFARCFPPSARLGRTGKILATWFLQQTTSMPLLTIFMLRW